MKKRFFEIAFFIAIFILFGTLVTLPILAALHLNVNYLLIIFGASLIGSLYFMDYVI